MTDTEADFVVGGMCYSILTFLAGLVRSACNTGAKQDDAATRSLWGGVRDTLSGYGLGRYVGAKVSRGGTVCVFASSGTVSNASRPQMASVVEMARDNAYQGLDS